jgi:hypothetical protein
MMPPRDNRICLVTALADSSGELLEKAEKNWRALQDRFADIAVHVTNNTHSDWRKFLEERRIPTAEARPDWDHIGLHRRRSISVGLGNSTCHWFFYADPDHILRWVERKPIELDYVLEQVRQCDFLVVGRSHSSFEAAPNRLKKTEAIVNNVYKLITGNEWDMMIAARGLSREAAELIVTESKVDTLGNDVAWPLLIERRGLSLGYTQADGLTYETNTVYAEDVPDNLDGDAAAWMLRVYTANQHIEAMRPFLSEE